MQIEHKTLQNTLIQEFASEFTQTQMIPKQRSRQVMNPQNAWNSQRNIRKLSETV